MIDCRNIYNTIVFVCPILDKASKECARHSIKKDASEVDEALRILEGPIQTLEPTSITRALPIEIVIPTISTTPTTQTDLVTNSFQVSVTIITHCVFFIFLIYNIS